MKKVLCITIVAVLVLALGLTLLAACDTDNGKIKISVGFWPDNSQASDVAMYNEWKENFEKDYPQYEIVAEPYTYSPETVAAKGNTGNLPTIFQTYFTEPESLIDQGFIRDITKQVEDLGWLDKIDDSMREQLTFDGKLYGIPRDGYGMGLFINLYMMYDMGLIERTNNSDGTYTYKLYDDNGKPLYPTTFDEITELSRKVKEYSPDKYGIIILSANKQGGWQLANMGWNFGTQALQVKKDGKWTANLNDAGMVRALEWIQQLAAEELCYPGASLNYNDWPAKVGSEDVLMAFVGNDALSQPITSYEFNKDDFAFVPMPTGDGTSRYALFGGTPYVFADNATDEQVEGALRFLKYIGRSPETDEIALAAMEKGFKVAQSKGMPILPTIKAWKDEAYLAIANEMENSYINVNYAYFKDFFDTIFAMRHDEEPYYCQEMYGLLDNAIQAVLSKDGANVNVLSQLTTQNNQFQSRFLDKIK